MRRFLLVAFLFFLSCPVLDVQSASPPAPAMSVDSAGQCAEGKAQICLSLCQEKVAVCNETGDEAKEACNKLATQIPSCASDGSGAPGSLCSLKANEIVPTQSAVGMFAAECRAKSIKYKKDGEKRGEKNLKRYLLKRPVPAVVGPGGQFFITDRHHLSTGVLKADIKEKRKSLYVCTLADKRNEGPEAFWKYMKEKSCTWLYNNKGEPIQPDTLPSQLSDLTDDPYRTFSRWVRNSCGYIKCGTACGGCKSKDSSCRNTDDLEMCKADSMPPFFLEFKWANYLREAVPIEEIYDLQGRNQGKELEKYLEAALEAVALPAANELEGFNEDLIKSKLVSFDQNTGCDL